MQGKLIEIHFSVAGKICGARVQTCKHAFNVVNLSFEQTTGFVCS